MAKRGGFPGGAMPGGYANMLKQAQRMQRQMEQSQKELEEREYTAKTGGGAVEVIIKGDKSIKSLKLSRDAVDPEDVETLEDMIVAAINEAQAQADADSEALMGKMTGGLGL